MADAETPTNEPGPGPGKDTVSPQMIGVLAFYLVILTGLLLWGIYRNWPSCVVICINQTTASTSPAPTPTTTPAPTQPTQTPTPTPTPTPTLKPTPTPTPGSGQQPTTQSTATITIESVSPKTGLINCNTQVTIKGKGFKKGASVIFGGVLVTVTGEAVDPTGQFITVQPPTHDEGEVDIVVKNPDGASSDIAKAAYTYTCPPAPETDLFLLVVFAGALGGTLHGLRSLYWYVGLRSLLKSWMLMYVLLPFTGATIAVVFYAIIRAGLLPIQTVQTSKNTSIAMIAIAVLVGLFSQQAAVKLKDIADAFLAKPAAGPPTESKPQGSVPPGGKPETKPPSAPTPAISPASGPANTPVKITGTGMKSVKSITFGGVQGTAVDIAADGSITVIPPPLPAGQGPKVEVVVTGDKDPPVKLEFTYTPQ